MNKNTSSRIDKLTLVFGILAPLAYFGLQIVAAPFYPGYSFFRDDASSLGSPDSDFPALFNVGTLAVGVLLLGSTIGVVRSLISSEARGLIAWGIVIAIACGGIGCLNAAAFPLPDVRHTSGLFAGIGMAFFLLPLLLPFLFYPKPSHTLVRFYFWLNLSVLVCLIPIVSGLIQRLQPVLGVEMPWYQDFLNNGSGALQRVAAAVVFAPIGVLSWHLLSTRSNDNPGIGNSDIDNSD